MTDFELLSFGMFMGAISLMIFIGVGVYMDGRRNNRADQGTLATDPANDIHIHRRSGSGGSYNRCTEQDIREHARKLGIKLEEGAKKRV